MFTWIWNKLKVPFDWFAKIVDSIWNSFKTGYAWLVALITTITASLTDLVNWLVGLLAMFAESLGWLSAQPTPTQADWSGMSSFLAFANTFLPLSEAFQYIQTLVLLMSVAITIRCAKLVREWIIA